MVALRMNRATLVKAVRSLREGRDRAREETHLAELAATELEKVVTQSKADTVSVSVETLANVFSAAGQLVSPAMPDTTVIAGLSTFEHFALDNDCFAAFDVRTLRDAVSPDGSLADYVVTLMWRLLTAGTQRSPAVFSCMTSLSEKLCLGSCNLFGVGYMTCIKTLLILLTCPEVPDVPLVLTRCILRLNYFVSMTRLEKEPGPVLEGVVGAPLETLAMLLSFIRQMMEALSVEPSISPAIMTSTKASLHSVFEVNLETTPYQETRCMSLHEAANVTLYLLLVSSNYYYMTDYIKTIILGPLFETLTRRFIIAHMFSPSIVTLSFASVELILRVYYKHAPLNFVYDYFRKYLFHILLVPELPCGEFRTSLLAHIGRLFSCDVPVQGLIFGLRELEAGIVRHAYPDSQLLDINDYEYLKLLCPRPMNMMLDLFVTFDCDPASANLVEQTLCAVLEYLRDAGSNTNKFYTQGYAYLKGTPHDFLDPTFQIDRGFHVISMTDSYPLFLHKLFHFICADYLGNYYPKAGRSANELPKGHQHASSVQAADHDASKSDEVIELDATSSDFVPNLLCYASFLGVDMYDVCHSVNFAAPREIVLGSCIDAAVYALSRVAAAEAALIHFQQYSSITKTVVHYERVICGSEKTKEIYARLFEGAYENGDISKIYSGHNSKRIFERGFALFDKKLEKGVEYFEKNGQLPPLQQATTPEYVEDPTIHFKGRRRTFEEQWILYIYQIKKHKAQYVNSDAHYDAIARFLFKHATENPLIQIGIPKDVIGEILGHDAVNNLSVLLSYGALFTKRWDEGEYADDFPIEEALRDFLGHFKIGGEAQAIDRIILFASYAYVTCKGARIRDHKLCHGVMFATIMLNTDQHSSSVRDKRMSKEDFVENTKRIDTGQQLTDKFLQDLYDSIRARPFSLGSIDNTRNLVAILDKHLYVPGGSMTLLDGTVIRGNLPTPKSKDPTLNIIGYKHEWYPTRLCYSVRDYLKEVVSDPRPMPSLQIVKDRYYIMFIESLTFKTGASVPAALIQVLADFPCKPMDVTKVQWVIRSLFLHLAFLHNVEFRHTRAIVASIVKDLVRITGLSHLPPLTTFQTTGDPSAEHSLSHHDTRHESSHTLAITGALPQQGTQVDAGYIRALMALRVVEFIRTVEDTSRQKPYLIDPLRLQPYCTPNLAELPVDALTPSSVLFRLPLNWYVGKLTGGEAWAHYLELLVRLDYYIDGGDRCLLPSWPVDPSQKKRDDLAQPSARIQQDCGRIATTLGCDVLEAENLYFIRMLVGSQMISQVYSKLSGLSSEELGGVMRFLNARALDADVSDLEQGWIYYVRRGTNILQSVLERSSDRFRRVFIVSSEMYGRHCDPETEQLLLDYYCDILRQYYLRITTRRRQTQSIDPASMTREITESTQVGLASDVASVVPSSREQTDPEQHFQRNLIQPLVTIVEGLDSLEVADKVLSFIEELLVSYVSPPTVSLAPASLIMFASVTSHIIKYANSVTAEDSKNDMVVYTLSRCDNISARLLEALKVLNEILPACLQVLAALALQTSAPRIGEQAMRSLKVLLEQSYGLMRASFGAEESQERGIVCYSGVPLSENPYVRYFAGGVGLLTQCSLSTDRQMHELGIRLYSEIIMRAFTVTSELEGLVDRWDLIHYILIHGVIRSMPGALTQTHNSVMQKASCSQYAEYAERLHGMADRFCYLIPCSQGGACCAFDECLCHTPFDMCLPLLLHTNSAPILKDVLLNGLIYLLEPRLSREFLVTMKLFVTYLFEIFLTLFESETNLVLISDSVLSAPLSNTKSIKSSPTSNGLLEFTRGLGYQRLEDVFPSLRACISVIPAWIELTTTPSPVTDSTDPNQSSPTFQPENICSDTPSSDVPAPSGEGHKTYIQLFDYFCHLLSIPCQAYQRIFREASAVGLTPPILEMLRTEILTLFEHFTSIQRLKLLNGREDYILLSGMFTAGSHMVGDAVVCDQLLDRISNTLVCYRELPEAQGRSDPPTDPGRLDSYRIMVVSALTCLSGMSRAQVEPRRRQIFEQCTDLILDSSRDIRLKIFAVMRALFV
ncbi:Sec7 family protein [Giardia muris]|uniref:Sec7 family protein n=1 Tax=Giardia muris TaxID=5742 RepID=A0A4Z1SZB0_GIAMU|nr:Sec7 family protein [Giardia muris]|eukprot:TNJ28818.1 Sec7 family protein [Giardia muris]